ncbi:MAG: glycoside hydrolase family 2, partial [Muribaculaceae bacterium]|nr:glycoside hydrolase family 2 [Muribaculaceae bacterium]
MGGMVSASMLGQATRYMYLSGTGVDNPVKWDFFCSEGANSGKWTTINVPGHWETQGFGGYNYGHDREPYNEKGFYRYEFEVPASWKGSDVYINFEGSMTDTDVRINGESAGPTHQGSFYPFKFNITPLLKPGKNLLEVAVTKESANRDINLAERRADYWIFGGIFRPVYL